MTTPEAGWYADPADAGMLRYWDGTEWTEHRSAAVEPVSTPTSPMPTEPPPSMRPMGAPPVFTPSSVPIAAQAPFPSAAVAPGGVGPVGFAPGALGPSPYAPVAPAPYPGGVAAAPWSPSPSAGSVEQVPVGGFFVATGWVAACIAGLAALVAVSSPLEVLPGVNWKILGPMVGVQLVNLVVVPRLVTAGGKYRTSNRGLIAMLLVLVETFAIYVLIAHNGPKIGVHLTGFNPLFLLVITLVYRAAAPRRGRR